MPNSFATLMLYLWPLVAIFLFRKLDTISAVFWTIVGGYLLLPVKVVIDLPMIPPLDKHSIPAIISLIGCISIKKIHIDLIPKKSIERWLFIVLLITPLLTTITNTEPVFNGAIWISGLTYFDAISAIIHQYFSLIPFILGVQLIKSYEDQLKLFKYLVIASLFYTLPILYEVRMSPQLHTSFYGFFPHNFGQTKRQDGFRAVVFLGHGILVATFIATSLGASAVMLKNKYAILGIPPNVIVGFLLLVLVLSKTAGALLLGMLLLFSIVWLPYLLSIRLAVLIMISVFVYPLLSAFGLFPHDALLQLAKYFSEDRAESLAYRFYYEHILLEHTKDKLLFGWGGWGRNRLWDTVTDGRAIRLLSSSGIFGFITFFGLPLISILRGKKSFHTIDNRLEKNLHVGHILIISIMMADQITNASLNGMVMLFTGALLGRANSLLKINPSN